jgi:hypothetical protein
MSVLGRLLIGSQQRVDLTDFLAGDSYTAGDFKYLIKSMTANPMILKGFEVVDAPLSIGTAGISIKVADSVVYYPTSNAGCFYYGLPEGNTLSTALVPELRLNATNYIYLVLTTENRAQDSKAFWDVDLNGGAGGEFNQDVNTESVLKAELGVSVSTFPEGSVPLCKVVMGATVITSITDCRNMMFRLGTGGVNPDPFNTFSWPELPSASYSRNETPVTITSSAAPTPFKGGDKNLTDLKSWMDAVMSKLLEISGTTFWYEQTAAVNLPSLFDDALGSTIKSKGQWLHSGSVPGLVTWSEDIIYKKINDPRDIIIRANPTSGAQLNNEQVLYVKFERDDPINVGNAAIDWVNGSLFVSSIAGNFSLLSKGDWIKKQSDDASLYYRVEETYSATNGGGTSGVASNVAQSIRLSSVYAGVTETAVGLRTKGEFKQSPAQYIVADRNDPTLYATGGDAYWLAVRSDTIVNLSNIDTVYFSGSINISDSDGTKAKLTFPSAHGLNDAENIVIAGAGLYNGTFKVEVISTTEIYIQTTATTNPSGVTASWAVVTTSARTNGYSYLLESASHGFNSGETVKIAGTSTAYDTYQSGLYVLAKRDAVTFQIPYDANTVDVSGLGTATVAKVILRTEFGSISVVQGENVDIGGDIQNLMDFIGMESLAQSNPDYQIPGDAAGLTLLAGSQNYNSIANDNLTKRVARLTGMMAGRVQDRGLGFHGRVTFRNETSGANQIVTVSGSLELSKPGSPNQIITLPATATLAANTALVATLGRESSSAITTAIESLGSPYLLAENKLLLLSRFSGTSVYAWDGSEVFNSASYTRGQLEDSQSKGIFVYDPAGLKMDSLTGVFTYTSALVNTEIVIPGAASNFINTAAINALSSAARTLPSGSCVWVRVNRRASKTFTNINTSATYQDSDSAGTLYITGQASVPVDQDVFVLYTNKSGALLQPPVIAPTGNVYEEDKVVVSGSPASDNEITGPVPSGTIVTIPYDSRNYDEIQHYVVGSGQLEVFLSGQRLRMTEDWIEVGTNGSLSTQIQIQQDLVVGDVLTFRIGTTGAVYFTSSPASTATLQSAYDNGSVVNVNTGTPITINGSSGKLLVVNGDVEITGVIDPKGIEFTRQSSDPLGVASDGLWVDNTGHLIQKRNGYASIDVTESITNPSSFITAGDALLFTASTLDVKTDSLSGIAISSDKITLVKDAAGAITGDSSTGIGVNLEPSNASLQISSNQLGVKKDPAGAIVSGSTGVAVNLETSNPSLQISSNKLGAKLNAAGAVISGASGLEVQLEASNASLQISSNRLGVKLNGSGAIVSSVSGLGLNIDSSLQIAGNVLSVANVGTILVDLTNNTGASIAAGIPVSADVVTGKFILANAGSLGSAQRYVGITAATIADGAVGKVQVGGLATVSTASFTVGQPVYLDVTPGTLTGTAPTATSAAILMLGVATTSTQFVMSTYLVGVKGNVYEESVTLGSPVTSGSSLTLPVDSRDGSSAQNYRVGSGDLEVYLNGQKLRVADDYLEPGTPGTFATAITIQQDLVAGDLVSYRVAPTQTSYAGGSLIDPMSSAGDLVYRNVSNITARLPVGTTGQVLTTTGAGIVAWANNPAGFSDPMTTAGDLIYKNSSGTTTRLGLGTTGQVLTVTGAGTASWSSPAAVSQEILLENNLGSTIAAFTPIRADSNGDMADIDVSVEASSLAIVGITKTSVPNGTAGSMVTSGRLENISGGFAFGDVIFVSKTGGLTNVKPDVGVNGFVVGDWVLKLGVITKNQSNPSLTDLIIQIQLMGSL